MAHPSDRQSAERLAELASNNARVATYVDALADRLVSSAGQQNRREVYRVSDYIASTSHTYGHPTLGGAALRLCAATEDASNENEPEIKSRTVKLIGAYGRASRPTEADAATG